MRKGTTPTITCSVNFDFRAADKLTLTITDGNKTVKLDKDNLTVTETTVVASLTQEQTLSFEDWNVKLQLKGKIGDSVVASNIVTDTMTNILDKEVM